MEEVEKLSQDSTAVSNQFIQQELQLASKHQLIRLDFEDSTDFSIKEIRIKNIDSLITEYRTESILLDQKIFHINSRYKSFDKTLQSIPSVLTTRKAITDNALWNHTDEKGEISTEIQKNLRNNSLVSEEINPLYISLSDSLSHTEAALNFALNRRSRLISAIDSLQKNSIRLIYLSGYG